MNRIESISERALELAGNVGDSMRGALPRAGALLDAGAKLGVLKAGTRVAGTFVRRHPAAIAAALAGAGLLWYAAHRRAKREGNGAGREAIDGSAKRVEAKRGNRRGTRTPRTGTRSGARARAAES